MSVKAPKLTERERAFVRHFMGAFGGNATQAAIAAGYSRRTARQAGSRLLTNVDVQKAIHAKREKLEAQSIMDAKAQDEMLTRIAQRHEERAPRTATRAIQVLGKFQGRGVAKLQVNLTLSEALERTGQPDEPAKPQPARA